MRTPRDFETALNKIEALAMAAGYLFEPDESALRLELIERIEFVAREALKPAQGGAMTMRNPVPLDVAEYRSGLACSLWSAILEKASDECSQDLLNLLSLACDINHEVHVSLSSGQGGASW